MPPPSTSTFTIAMHPPPGPPLTLPTPTNSSPPSNPRIFNDAMAVRLKVFVEEQGCSAAAEIDDDDTRSWQWVMYSPTPTPISYSTTTTTTGFPIAVIRLVPPPHPPHEILTQPHLQPTLPPYDFAHEPFIKLTRVAVLPEYRGLGLARRLVQTALEWAGSHAAEIERAYHDVSAVEEDQKRKRWQGLTLVHAQVPVEAFYRKLGFETDKELGVWDEEGIQHVGMWRRIDVRSSTG